MGAAQSGAGRRPTVVPQGNLRRRTRKLNPGYARITFKEVLSDEALNNGGHCRRFTFDERGGAIVKLKGGGAYMAVPLDDWESGSVDGLELIRVHFIQESFFLDGRHGSRTFVELPKAEDGVTSMPLMISDNDVLKLGRTDVAFTVDPSKAKLKMKLVPAEQKESYFSRVSTLNTGGNVVRSVVARLSSRRKESFKVSAKQSDKSLEDASHEHEADSKRDLEPGSANKKWIVTPEGATVGRKPENDIILFGDEEVAGWHGTIEFKNGNYYFQHITNDSKTFRMVRDRRRIIPGESCFIEAAKFEVLAYEFTVNELQGSRKTMEDRSLAIQHFNISGLLLERTLYPRMWVAIYDGHGGDTISDQLRAHLHVNVATALASRCHELNNATSTSVIDNIIISALHETFVTTDRYLAQKAELTKDSRLCGSTAITALILGRRMYVSNVGDSRCVLSRGGHATNLSHDQKASRSDEADRVRKLGGVILQNRLMGQLAVTRAFGDFQLKEPAPSGRFGPGQQILIAEPEVMVLDLRSDDEFMVLACDGLFDVMTSQAVVDFVRNSPHFTTNIQQSCQDLIHHAVDKLKTRDNVTAAIVQFKYSLSRATLMEKVRTGLSTTSPKQIKPSPRVR